MATHGPALGEPIGMLIDGKHQRTIWVADDGRTVRIIDQRCCRTSCAWST